IRPCPDEFFERAKIHIFNQKSRKNDDLFLTDFQSSYNAENKYIICVFIRYIVVLFGRNNCVYFAK
ncbi:MAG: hypothetical protein MJ000_11845, partial [Bacteroidales bacterium]|nr:hypothetical protein [Bacteroidales bacterium]